ncbi:MAG: hypothetical protein K9N23_13740 [Akkermansiaceae bacterium]|nr:hypothetical protein [Akkermansiaceae bacterium]MCF7732746.1 hypothetical protein [Akkermansiaceae bacterium]
MPTYNASTPTERPDHVEAGDYEVEVTDAIETVSKTGHEMIELKLKTSAGSFLYDFLVFIPNAFWKIDSFRAATGEVVTPEDDVEITGDDLIGRTAFARLIVEEYKGKKRNKVAAWLTPRAGTKAAPKAPKPATLPEAVEDDNIPF